MKHQHALESERFLQAALDALDACICILDAEGKTIQVNSAWRDGAEADQLAGAFRGTGWNYLDVCDAAQGEGVEDARAVARGIREVLARDRETFSLDYSCHAGEEKRWYVVRVSRCRWDGPPRVVVAHQDITEHVLTRQALTQSRTELRLAQKMEAIGQLAGGVAHDFNNILTGVMGYSQLLEVSLEEGDPLRGYAREIYAAGMRAADLTRQLLAFSRRQILQPRVLNPNALLTGMEQMLQRLIGEDVELALALAKRIGNVKADPGQLEQVIMNLVVNARDAMPEGGKLTIETANVDLDEVYAKLHTVVQPGPYVMVTVTDTGCGMEERTLARVFEPFFTTKEQGKGTGLGLSTVYGIVKQSGGYIWVYSEPSLGTTFKIYLPREKAEADRPAPSLPRPAARGSETILVVEDEAIVRQLVRRTLESHGYTVLEASHGGEALQLCARHDQPIHLLLTDVVMPAMGGVELAEKMEAVYPEMRVLFMSGYTDHAVVRHEVLEAGSQYLQKPFTAADLTRKVRDLLDGPVPV